MMDASNPVLSNDRRTIGEVMEASKLRRRQNLTYIAEVARTSQRVVLPVASALLPVEEVRQLVTEYRNSRVKVDASKDGDLPEDIFRVVYEDLPVCGLMDELGVPLHPAGINNSQGKLCVNRIMGGEAPLPLGLSEVAEVAGGMVLERAHVYTGGTWKGFLTRLAQQMARKTVPLRKTLSITDKEVTFKAALDTLDQYMPRQPNKNWPGVHTDLYTALTEGIKITSNSSAGAPYWRNKGECMDQILDVGIPILVEAIKDNKLEQLWKENPELFICEVKNKMDRYEVEKLDSKTRPYTCVPAHVAFLLSMLTQGFQETLEVFSEETSPHCSNAYGFSSANGGMNKLHRWMRGATKRGKVICYGDDAKIVVRKGNDIYCVDPDFKQMDGSLDADDIELTIRWVLRHLRKDSGETQVPHFWKAVADLWKLMATNPMFVVDGKKVYRKVSPNGLMTGVPGTTLFDTVKSVLAWNAYLDKCEMDGTDVLSESNATGFMKAQGLVIKPGTWSPERLPQAKPGVLMTSHKFLGVQMLCTEWRGELLMVPTIPESEALHMMVVQKDSPFEKNKSKLSASRTLYDRMRGYMITCGFAIPLMRDAIHNVVNHLPPEAILMDVQTASGEKPDHILLQDFMYPDSTGFPSVEFCLDLYQGHEDKSSWTQIYPELVGKLGLFKTEERQWGSKLKAVIKKVEFQPGFLTMHFEDKTPKPKEIDPILESAVAFDKVEPLLGGQPNSRSFICKVADSNTKTPVKRMPTVGDLVISYLKDIGGVGQLGVCVERLGVAKRAVVKDASKYAYYLTGEEEGDLLSLYPIQTPMATIQDEIVDHNREAPIGERKVKAFDPKAPVVVTKPDLIYLNMQMVSNLPRTHRVLKNGLNGAQALEALQPLITSFYAEIRWETLPVVPNADNPVGVRLLVDEFIMERFDINKVTVGDLWAPPLRRTQELAQAWSKNATLAKQYIAKTILELCGVVCKETSLTTTMYPPPPDFADSWYEQTLRYEDPKLDPPISDPTTTLHPLSELMENTLFSELATEFPNVDPSRIRAAISLTRSNPETQKQVVRRWISKISLKQNQRQEKEDPATSVSKRSLMTPTARRRLNRNNELRKKRRRLEKQTLQVAPPLN
uniref:VP1 protein n=1 Tax=Fopius arisanus TaxID=64838 RepID=A0A0C9R625_9HYME